MTKVDREAGWQVGREVGRLRGWQVGRNSTATESLPTYPPTHLPTSAAAGYGGGGASLNRNTLKSWQPNHYSAKEDIDRHLKTLRSRAHDLAINSAIGAAAIKAESVNVIGAGLKLFPRVQSKVLNLSTEEARRWSSVTKREFELWAKDCDFARRNNFAELQRIAFESRLVDGDSFCLFRRRLPTAQNPYTLKLQLLESGRVSNPSEGALNDYESFFNGNRIVNGIEIDSDGAQVAVWISNRWRDEPTALEQIDWRRVEWYGRETGEKNLLHICADSRPDQFRGVPLLAPAIEPLKQISRYADAELTSAIIKSFFSVFFTQPLTNTDLNGILPDDELNVDEYKLGPATIAALPRGVDVKAINNSNAQSTFDGFVGAFAKQIGAAIGIPYEVLMKNFTASYSASRAALLQAADEFRVRRAGFVNDFCQPIYELWLAEAVASGRIEADGFFTDPIKRAAWSSASWHNEQTHFLDPVKEVEGIRKRIELGLTTREKEAAELCGTDYWENLELLRAEESL